jgi:energy-converting hydrogenase Eha subunit A
MWYLAGIPVVERNHAMVVNTFLWTILALIVIIARFYTRAVLVKSIGYDDWLMLSAMVSLLFPTPVLRLGSSRRLGFYEFVVYSGLRNGYG